MPAPLACRIAATRYRPAEPYTRWLADVRSGDNSPIDSQYRST